MKPTFIGLLKKEYPNGVELHYIDYRDSLDEHPNLLTAIIQGNTDTVHETIRDWYFDDRDSLDYCMKEALGEDYQEKLSEEEQQEAIDRLRDNDKSDIYKDLLRNTSNQVFAYDLDYYMEAWSRNWTEAELIQEAKKIAKIAWIVYSKNKEALYYIVAQATYWGTLCFMRYDSIESVQDGDNLVIDWSIQLWVVDYFNGSWSVEQVKMNKTIKLNRSKLSVETENNYSRVDTIAWIHKPAYSHPVHTK